MKQAKRLGTNQSNKKEPKQANKSPSFQLPNINKTSNYDTNSNLSYDFQIQTGREAYYGLDQIEQNDKQEVGMVNYQKMTMEDIKNQYHRLRQQVVTISSQIKKKQEFLKSKIMKKPIKTIGSQDAQKKIAQLQQEIYENSHILTKLRVQYEQVQKRSNLSNSSISKPNADLNEKALEVRQKILTLKEKIKMLKRKTKKTGDDIVNGEDIHEILQKLLRQQKAIYAKQTNLEGKIQEITYKAQRQTQKLADIEYAYAQAEDYLKLFKLENEEQVQKNGLVQELRQKQHRQEILKKKIQSDQQTFLQKYHQLLKVFELQNFKLQKMNKKIIDADVNVLKAQNIILDLEQEWDQLEQIIDQMNEQDTLKREAQSLRQIIQKQSRYQESTFMTGFTSTSSKMTNHIMGVKSIIQQNQSDLRQTIDLTGAEIQSIQTNKNDHTQKKYLFTKIQKSTERINGENIKNQTSKSIAQDSVNLNGGKYFLSSKQISGKRQQQKMMVSIRMKSTNSNVIQTRKASSVLKTSENLKLKELSMNRTTKNQKQAKHNKILQKHSQNSSKPNKQPYISLKSNRRQQQIDKGKDVLRQRKSSLKIVTNTQKQENHVAQAGFLQQLEQMNRQLLSDGVIDRLQSSNQRKNQDSNNQKLIQDRTEENSRDVQKLQITKPLYNSSRSKKNIPVSQESNRSQLSGIKVKPSSKEGGSIRHQKIALKPEISQEIDKTNIEYNRKIQQLKRQIANKQSQEAKQLDDDKCSKDIQKKEHIHLQKQQIFLKQPVNQKQNVFTDDVVGRPNQFTVKENILASNAYIQHKTINQPQTIFKKLEQQDRGSRLKSNEILTESEDSSSDLQDEDVSQDISQINRMIKKKLQAAGGDKCLKVEFY